MLTLSILTDPGAPADEALAIRVAALREHVAAEPDDVPNSVMAAWCDRQEELLESIAATPATSLPGILLKVNAAFDRLLADAGDDPLRGFLPSEREMFAATAHDVKVALARLVVPA